ncbi:hypothetical protein INR49_020428 [Caranx melampygus]|nr:hypothetical protein INR49_020428 [Caranx melampygus]
MSTSSLMRRVSTEAARRTMTVGGLWLKQQQQQRRRCLRDLPLIMVCVAVSCTALQSCSGRPSSR